MGWNETQGYWREFSGEMKKRWGKFTDDDIAESKGNRDILIGKLQKMHGMSADDAKREISTMEYLVKEAREGGRRMHGGGR